MARSGASGLGARAVRLSGAGQGRRVLYATAIQHGLFGVTPVLGTVCLLYVFRGHWFAVDFRLSYWPAAHQIVHGLSPYLAQNAPSQGREGFPYPAVGALVIAPFGLLPRELASALFTALNIAAVPAALRLLGVRDWRIYGVVFLWLPVISGWETANVTLLFLLGIAAVWRYRDRPLVAGVLTAFLISVKPFVWPLALWLLLTRRYASVAYGAAFGLVANVVAWAIIGFGEVHRFIHLLGELGSTAQRSAYSLVAVLMHAGASPGVAYTLGLAPGVAIFLAWLVLGREAEDRTAMIICIAVILFLSSVVWLQYFALLIVPLALARPRLSLAWGLPMLMSACVPIYGPEVWQQALALAAGSAAILVVLQPRDPLRLRLPRSKARLAAASPRP